MKVKFSLVTLKEFYEGVQELDAREKSLNQSLCRILLPSDAFYYVHPIQVGLLEDPVKLGVLMNAKILLSQTNHGQC